MKRFIVLCVFLVLAGCGDTSQERLDGLAQFLGMAKEQSALIDEDIQTLKKTLADLQSTANDPGLSPEDSAKITNTLVEVSGKLDKAIAAKVKVDRVIAQAETEIARIAAEGNANIGDEIAAVGSVLMISSAELPPPIGVWVGIVGTLIGAIGGVVGKRARAAKVQSDAEKATLESAAKEIVKSVDVALSKQPTDVLVTFKNDLKSYQSSETRDVVREIRAA